MLDPLPQKAKRIASCPPPHPAQESGLPSWVIERDCQAMNGPRIGRCCWVVYEPFETPGTRGRSIGHGSQLTARQGASSSVLTAVLFFFGSIMQEHELK